MLTPERCCTSGALGIFDRASSVGVEDEEASEVIRVETETRRATARLFDTTCPAHSLNPTKLTIAAMASQVWIRVLYLKRAFFVALFALFPFPLARIFRGSAILHVTLQYPTPNRNVVSVRLWCSTLIPVYVTLVCSAAARVHRASAFSLCCVSRWFPFPPRRQRRETFFSENGIHTRYTTGPSEIFPVWFGLTRAGCGEIIKWEKNSQRDELMISSATRNDLLEGRKESSMDSLLVQTTLS